MALAVQGLRSIELLADGNPEGNEQLSPDHVFGAFLSIVLTPSLKSLKLMPETDSSFIDWHCVENLQNLRRLVLGSVAFEHSALIQLAQQCSENLQHIELCHVWLTTGSWVEVFDSFALLPGLTYLRLTSWAYCKFTDGSVQLDEDETGAGYTYSTRKEDYRALETLKAKVHSRPGGITDCKEPLGLPGPEPWKRTFNDNGHVQQS